MKSTSISALALGAFLVGCSSVPEFQPVTVGDIGTAICSSDYSGAQSLAATAQREGLNSAEFQILKAYAFESGGQAMAARPIYDRVMKSGATDSVSLVCDKVRYEGSAAQVAYDQLRALEIKLATMDVTERQLRSATPIVPPPEPPAPPKPMVVEQPIPVKPPAPAPKPEPAHKTMSSAWLHLASYKGPTWAKRGWKKISKKYPQLQKHTPIYRKVDLKLKGPMVRLGAGGFASVDEAKTLCRQLKAVGQYCNVMKK